MGPIDFSKFELVKDKYLALYDLPGIAKEMIDLHSLFPAYSNYISIFDNEKKLENIITADNIELQKLKNDFDNCSLKFKYKNCDKTGKKKDPCKTCPACLDNLQKREFHSKILTILDYEKKGKYFAREVYSKVGMKTCYVCNAQYALSIDPEKRSLGTSLQQERYMSKFQFDHYLPRAKYPALSISLFNLLPICPGCNLIKGERDIGINFLSTDPKDWDGKFTFNIVESTLTFFLLQQEPLELEFIDTYTYKNTGKTFAEKYDIKGIYNSQIDLIEELIVRKLKYSETYKNKLSESFPELFKNIKINERIELGTYTKKEGIHNRPMSKFIQDVDQQIDDYFSKIIL